MMASLSEKTALERLREDGLKYLLAPAALIILYIFFGIFGRNFFSYITFVNIIDAAYYIGFISVGVTFVIITGGIDLSVGTVMMASTIIGGTIYRDLAWPLWLSLLVIIAVGALFGLFNGIMISRLKIPPFIVTLGTMMISMGVGSIVSGVRSATFPTRAVEDGWYKDLFKIVGDNGITLPTGALVLLAVVVVSHIILTQTRPGRYIYAIGSNKEAARLSGVNVERYETLAYVIAGTYAGIGGISYAATYTTVLPSAGQGFELFAIAGAVIGGTSLAGGIGTVFGTLIGVFIMSVLSVGLPSMGLQAHYQTFFTGVVVIGAVMLDMYRNRAASEVKVLSPADQHRADRMEEANELRSQAAEARLKGDTATAENLMRQSNEIRKQAQADYRRMKKEEKAEQARLRAKEREEERELQKLQDSDQ